MEEFLINNLVYQRLKNSEKEFLNPRYLGLYLYFSQQIEIVSEINDELLQGYLDSPISLPINFHFPGNENFNISPLIAQIRIDTVD